MTNAPPPTDAEIVEALEALAVENDEVDAVVSGGEHRAPLLRLASSRLAALAAENERMREALDYALSIGRGPSGRIIMEKHEESRLREMAGFPAREQSK